MVDNVTQIRIFESRLLNENDYPTIQEWGEFWRFPLPPRNFLPNNGLDGIMVVDNHGVEYCAGFIYSTNSDVCWIEYIFSNPKVRDKSLRQQSLLKLLGDLRQLAKNMGFVWAFTSVKNENLIKKYEAAGWTKGSTGTTEMITQL